MIPTLLVSLAMASTDGDGEALSFLALGDSYTIGEGVPATGRWPAQLAAKLRARGIAIDAPRIVARTGWTTDELDEALDEAELPEHYDLVSLSIGVNNQYRGRDLAEYRGQFADLLDRAIGFAGGDAKRVFVLSIPDWGTTPFAEGRDRAKIARELDAFNAAARDVAAKRGVAFVDITPISREVDAKVAGDGLHPAAEQYALWADAALPVVAKLLGH